MFLPMWNGRYLTHLEMISIGLNFTLCYSDFTLLFFWILIQVRKPYNLILINLAMVEFVLSIVGLPIDVLALITRKWILGKNLCVVSGSVVTTCGKTHWFPFICVLIDIYIMFTATLCRYHIYVCKFFLRFCIYDDSLCIVSCQNEKFLIRWAYKWEGIVLPRSF